MINAIIFDFFGVVVGDGFDETYRLAGGDPIKDRYFIKDLLEEANRALISPQEFRQKICDHLGIALENYSLARQESETINTELLGYIVDLKKKYKTALLSNVNRGGLERRINRDVLSQHFDVIVESGEVGYIKPEPEIYKLTAQRLGVEPKGCVFIDDREPYVEAAKRVGMKAIVYRDFPSMRNALENLLATSTDE